MAILVLSAVVPVSACWASPVPFEIFSEDGSRVFVFDPDQYGMGNANAAVYDISNNERQLLYTVEDLGSFAYESNFNFTADLTHFIRTFPAPGIPVFEVFSYGVRTRVVLRSDFIEDYFAGAEGPPALSIGPSFTVGWQIIDRSPDGSTITISTGEDNTFVFDIMTAAFIGDDLPSWVQNPSGDTPSSWVYESVERADELGLLPDIFRSGFRRSTTRAEFATIAIALYEHFREPITGRISFTDTTDTNVEKAAYLGIVSGIGNNRFDPNSTITREQAAVMLARLAEAVGHPLPLWQRGLHPSTVIADYDDISSWAVQSIAQIYQAGIMSGVGDRRFAPQSPYTREQSIVTILRLFDMVNTELPNTLESINETSDIVMNYANFLELLETNGFTFEEIYINAPDWLSVGSRVIRIDNTYIAIYQYNSNEEMERDSTFISPGGSSIYHSIPTNEGYGVVTEISWAYRPFWFKRDMIIVRYVGENETIINFLFQIFGDTFV